MRWMVVGGDHNASLVGRRSGGSSYDLLPESVIAGRVQDCNDVRACHCSDLVASGGDQDTSMMQFQLP